jgi:signal transduction histidine kinase/DNA-binding NarL/FixJ family response regulator
MSALERERHILLIDADEQSAQDIRRFLKISAYAFSVEYAQNVQDGLRQMEATRPDIILLDGDVVKESSFAAFKQQIENENIPVILLSDVNGSTIREQAKSAGAQDFITKNKINLFHLQKSISNTLKMAEAESEFERRFSEYSLKQQALYNLLDKTDTGILIINDKDNILYANSTAYRILGEEGGSKQLANYFGYRAVEEEETLSIQSAKGERLSIKVSATVWNGEAANLFMLQAEEVSKAGGLPGDKAFTALLNAMNENILLLKDERIVFGNRSALKSLHLNATQLSQKAVKDIFDIEAARETGVTVKNLLNERAFKGSIKQVGNRQQVVFSRKPLNLDGDFYELLTFSNAGEVGKTAGLKQEISEFTAEGILHLASHDLREPVRTILNYVQLATDNIGKQNYEAATEYAGYAQAAADRMDKLLTDLKAYISLSDYQLNRSKVSLNQVLAQVLKELKPKIETAGAEVNTVELPEAMVDRELAAKLFSALIDNALKFSKKGRKPVLDIGFDKYEGNILFCVRDNGIGISKKYQQKIFDLFARLNRIDEYPGNGLGLALSKKIIDIHGGKIWVESLPGFGSSFYFMFGK